VSEPGRKRACFSTDSPSGGEPLSEELEAKIEKALTALTPVLREHRRAILRAFAREIQTSTLADEVGTNLRIAERIGIVDAIKAGKADVLASAEPHPLEHPAMTKAWTKARDVLCAYREAGRGKW
jgi:hypothetical protein